MKPFNACDVCGKHVAREESKGWIVTQRGADACSEECRSAGESAASKKAVREAALDWAVALVRT